MAEQSKDNKKPKTERQAFAERLSVLTKSVFSEPDAIEWLELMKQHFGYYRSDYERTPVNPTTGKRVDEQMYVNVGQRTWPLYVDAVLNEKLAKK